MAVDQQNVSRILSVLSHHIRREILLCLSEQKECSFTDLANSLNVDTGKLSFHIRNLADLIEQTTNGKYRLSKAGEKAIILISDLEAWSGEIDVANRTTKLAGANASRRAYAFLIDFAFAFTVFMVVPSAPSSFVSGAMLFQYINDILFLILFWAYSTLLEGFAGQTLGKRLTGLRVVSIDGKKLSYDRAAVRNLGKIFLLPIDLLAGTRLNDKRFLRYFDKFSGTTVIDLRS